MIDTRKKSKYLFLAAMLAFPLAHFAIFWVYVNVNSILLAFKSAAGNTMVWSTANFERFFLELGQADSPIRTYIKATLSFFPVSTLLGTALSLVLSYFLFKKVPFSNFYRVVFYLPQIISAIALTLILQYVLHLKGPVNTLLQNMGLEKIDFLGSKQYALRTVLFYCLWSGMGTNIILFSAGMSRIPTDVFESLKTDGCGLTMEFARVVVPMIWPTVSTMLIIGVANIFTVLGPVLLLTEGKNDTATISFFIYNQVKYANQSAYGYASAIGICFSAVGMALVFAVRWVCNKVTEVVEV